MSMMTRILFKPTIAIHSDNASPSNSTMARPKFTVGGLVTADNGAVTLHKGSDCTGTAISASVDVYATTSHDITVTSDMSAGGECDSCQRRWMMQVIRVVLML